MEDQAVRDSADTSTTGPRCPVCGGTAFGAYRGRPAARCRGCGSKERGRLMAMALRQISLRASELPVVHVAPERAIADILIERFGDSYIAADIAPEEYAWSRTPVRKLDLTRPFDTFAPESLQGIVHSHVLEHLPGAIDRVIAGMNALIAPGGFHLFQVPVHPGWYREDMDPGLPAAERMRLFHQEDHLRVFGEEDFADRCLGAFTGLERVDLRQMFSSEALQAAAVPVNALRRFTGHTPFLFIKPPRSS